MYIVQCWLQKKKTLLQMFTEDPAWTESNYAYQRDPIMQTAASNFQHLSLSSSFIRRFRNIARND